MKTKRFVSLITVIAVCAAIFANLTITSAEESEVYTVDFTKLTAATYESGQELKIDDNTTVYFKYGGSIASDGLRLIGNNGGNGAYTNASYIEFTAPSSGEAAVNGGGINAYLNGTSTGSYIKSGATGNLKQQLTEGQKYQVAQRQGEGIIKTLTFTPITIPDITDVAEAYKAPKTTWDFDTYTPAKEGKNLPVISGTAEYDATNKNVKFNSATTSSGALTVEFDPTTPTEKDSIKIDFDTHMASLGLQYFTYSVFDTEENELVYCSFDQYNGTGELRVGGVKIADAGDFTKAVTSATADGMQSAATHFNITLDFKAMRAQINIGSKKYSDIAIQASSTKDVKMFKIESTRSKTGRSIYVDNLTIEEYNSDAQAATSDIVNGYDAKTYGTISSRVKAPSVTADKPLVIFLSSKTRFGTDNEGQLYQAQYLFNKLADDAIVAAPQAVSGWNIDAVKTYLAGIKAEYNPTKVIVAGQGEGAATAYALAKENLADKVIAISGSSDITATNAKIWTFAGYLDENLTAIRTTVNRLQTTGTVDVTYTEYPYDGTNIGEKAANTTGLKEWILNDTENNKVVDLAIFMGQSNMAGRGDYADATECAPGHGFEYHAVTEPGVLTTVSEPFGRYEENDNITDSGRNSGDMISSFIESYYQTSGVPLVGVKAARGGTDTNYWTASERKTEAVARYNEAKKFLEDSGYTIGKQFMVWCQGESDGDKGRSDSAHTSKLSEIFGYMKDGTTLTDMFIVRIGHCRSGSEIDPVSDPIYKRLNLAQKAFADETANVTAVASLYTDEYLALMRDNYHYYQPAYNSVGTVAGNNTAVTLYNKGIWTNYPEPAADVVEELGGIFEKTSSDAEITVSDMTSYGADTFRVYKADKSYVDVKASGGKIANPTGNAEVTVVPIYRFNYASAAKDGYTSARSAYTKETGYGAYGSVTLDENGALPSSGSLRVLLPNGRYDINVQRAGGTRFNVYNDGYRITTNEGINTKPQNRGNESALMYAPQVLNEDQTIDITVSGTNGSPRISELEIVRVPDKYKKSVVWIAGDSESANYYPQNADGDDLASNKIMRTGFGMMLPKFLNGGKYKLTNLGEPSATIKTWSDGNLDSVLHNIDSGDTIIVDFGINEKVSGSNGLSQADMQTYMQQLFTAVKAKGAKPILVSPVSCGQYQDRAYFRFTGGTNDMYSFAETAQVDCIDLNKYLQQYITAAAEDTATSESDWKKFNYHEGDNLHITQHGALLAASFIAAGMKALGYETTDYAYTYTDISSIGDNYTRGTETENKRVYSVAAAERFMADGTITKPSGGGEPAKKPSGTIEVAADKTVTVTISNTDNAVLIRARHESGVLKAVDAYDNLTFNDGTATKQISDLKNGDELYLWNTLKDMQPLCQKKTVTELTDEPVESEKPQDPDTTPEPTNTPILSIDFESATEGSAASGWTQSNAGTATIKKDSANSTINQYMEQGNTANNARASWYSLPTKMTDSFVFEADILAKSSNNSSANLSLLSSSTTVNSTAKNKVPMDGFLLKAEALRDSTKFVLNNAETSNDTRLEEIKGKKIVSDTYDNTKWVHVRAICDFTSKTTALKLTSLDGKTVYFDGKVDMSEEENKDLSRIYVVAPRYDTMGIDNITVRRANNSELAEVKDFVNVTVEDRGTSYTYYNKKNSALDERYLPDTSVYTTYFEGWQVNGQTYTADELKTLKLSTDTTISAKVSDAYIEKAVSVEFDKFPENSLLAMSADSNSTDFLDNAISLKITGEAGTDLAANPNSNANAQIIWEFTGFHTMHGEPTRDDETTTFPGEKRYCDDYAKVTVDSNYDPEISFALRNTSENYYGKVKATVTYNGTPFTVEKPLMIAANTTAQPGALLPKGGYISDYNMFEDGMEGDYTSDALLLGGWSTAGGSSGALGIGKDTDGKYLKLSKNETTDKCHYYNQLEKTSDQLVFDQMIRFKDSTVNIYYKAESINSYTNKDAFCVGYASNKLKLNGTELKLNGTAAAVSQNTWYRLVVSAASSSQKVFAKLYDANNTLIGETEVLAYTNDVSEPYMYGYQLKDKSAAATEVDVNKLTIKNSAVNKDTMTLNLGGGAVTIPNGDTPVTLSISVDNAKTADGYDAIGKASWKIDDASIDGVTIEAGNDSHTATVSVTKEAAAGDVPIAVTIDGVSVKGTIKLTGTRNAVAFTKTAKSVLIPDSGSVTEEFTAVLRNGQGENIAGEVTYSLEGAPSGVQISAAGELTVPSTAAASEIYVVAASGSLTRKTKVVLYKLDFTFGSGIAASGSTLVGASDIYDSAIGFGIEGSAADTNGYIEGNNLVFKAKVEAGKVYNVTVKYKGNMAFERFDGYLTGINKDANTSLAEKTYEIAVVGDGVLDLNMYGASQQLASVKITKQADKQKGSKPKWIEIGDSTVAQNPSWGYVLNDTFNNYAEIKAAAEGFANMGRGGRQLTSFYTEGSFDSVLRTVRPGDVVSISGMGTNGYDGTISDFKNQLNYYIDSIIDMGGYVILGSYTPYGNWNPYKGQVYNAETETFTGKRRADYDTALKEVYNARQAEDRILGYVDIGQLADDLMTAEVKKARDAASGDETAKKAAAQAKADELLKWWPNDFNHYTSDLSKLILPELTKQVAALINTMNTGN